MEGKPNKHWPPRSTLFPYTTLFRSQPGWKWSECIKPVVGTDSCQVEHIGYCVSGSLHVQHDDGTEAEVKPGEVYRVAPGHDAWTVGNEPAVFVEFQGAANYAKGS